MLTLNKYETAVVCGGFSSYISEPMCECQCRQHRTESLAIDASLPKEWYRLNGEIYEDVVIGDACGLKECLEFCTTMNKNNTAGNLFKACIPIKEE